MAKKVQYVNGASNLSDTERAEYDYYATPREVTQALLDREKFYPIIWEPACGEGAITNVLCENGYNVLSSDIVHRPSSPKDMIVFDFLSDEEPQVRRCDIVTNPPYEYAQQFVEHAMSRLQDGQKLAMFLKLTFLEGKKRYDMFQKYPPKHLYVFSDRVQCAKNGDFEHTRTFGGAVAYGWYVWEKGFTGATQISWIKM